MTEKVITRTAELWVDDDAIFRVKLLPDVHIDAEDITDNLLVTRNLTGGKPFLRLLDARTRWNMTPEAEVIFKSEDVPSRTIARAVVTKSLADKLFKSFLITLFKPNVPLKFFLLEEEAVKWLLSFRKENIYADTADERK